MTPFENMIFKGTFRDYQQRVLDNADRYLKDGKINIVAAPGSGKTVLGLELIRRLDSPCLILSPTTAIREQWGERFKQMFLEKEEDFEALFSNDLHSIRLLNSVTYQALYTAVEKIPSTEDGDIDCSDVDLFAEMRSKSIKTICLDEAHHLKNEWQKALEKFLSALDLEIKIISLTATPPYDSDSLEWGRYMNVCGEIDEEIFVPELVGQNTLCPHQDYVYFNYPSDTEAKSFAEHRECAAFAIEEMKTLEVLKDVCHILNEERDYEKLFSSVKEYIALVALLDYCGFEIHRKLIKELTAGRRLPLFKLKYAETAIQFLLDGDLITEEQKEPIIAILKKYGLYQKKKVTLILNEKLKRSLISSVGKLQSIKKIAESEIASLGENLRMLVLTDYIKKENLAKIATEETFHSVNIVSIFETIRRANKDVKIGVLSGSLIILPQSIDLSEVKHSKHDIPNTEYCTVEISGSNHLAVNCVGKLFEQGEIQILIGTKSLLGEGWDSPCINSLILGSVVGSFVLSNQMRGRAIRIDKNNPDKTANIWHLVTVEPEYMIKEKLTEQISEYMQNDVNELTSCDYDILKRRFDSFMGPNYMSGAIESGIARITAIRPPYDKPGVAAINEEMLERSACREEVKTQWNRQVSVEDFSVEIETEIPKENKVPVFTFWNVAITALILSAQGVVLQNVVNAVRASDELQSFWSILATITLTAWLLHRARRVTLHANPARSFRTLGVAIYNTLRQCGEISSAAKVDVSTAKGLESVAISLRNATIHEQNIFNKAMTEMLSPIKNPRYLLIAKRGPRRYNYALSFACPSVIGRKKEYVEVLAEELKKTTEFFVPVYVHCEEGRRLILKCRKKSYITYNEKHLNSKYKVSHWE